MEPIMSIPANKTKKSIIHSVIRTYGNIASVLIIAAIALTVAALPASAKSAYEIRASGQAEIPICSRTYGTISVEEPQGGINWWTKEKLPAPSTLIKVFVQQSRCFTLVDRGTGFQAGQKERDLAASGELRKQSHVGRGQISAADYIMVAELASQNSNAGGNNIGGLLGRVIGGNVGRVVGGINTKTQTADVVLHVTDMRSSEMVAVKSGHGKKTDIGYRASGALWGRSGLGAAGVGGYANTEMGQVIALAYLDAYIDMIIEFGDLPESASANAELQSMEVIKPARMYTAPDDNSEVVRTLEVGMWLYPTGEREGVWREVEDELGNIGWVSSTVIQLTR
jgi:hypothetical protein